MMSIGIRTVDAPGCRLRVDLYTDNHASDEGDFGGERERERGRARGRGRGRRERGGIRESERASEWERESALHTPIHYDNPTSQAAASMCMCIGACENMRVSLNFTQQGFKFTCMLFCSCACSAVRICFTEVPTSLCVLGSGFLLACLWLFVCLPACAFASGCYISLLDPSSDATWVLVLRCLRIFRVVREFFRTQGHTGTRTHRNGKRHSAHA